MNYFLGQPSLYSVSCFVYIFSTASFDLSSSVDLKKLGDPKCPFHNSSLALEYCLNHSRAERLLPDILFPIQAEYENHRYLFLFLITHVLLLMTYITNACECINNMCYN